MVSLSCPNCHHTFGVPSINSIEAARGATLDCPGCGALLLCRHADLAIVDFHAQVHADSGGTWPKDGAGTYSLDIETGRIEETRR